MILKSKGKTTISADELAALSFILYFSMPLLKRLLRPVSAGLTIYVAIAITYLPVLFLLFMSRKKFHVFLNFMLFLLAVCFFFLITYFVHPEYKFFYARNYFGIWDYVLRPDNGIYAFLFIRLIDDPKKILKCLIISSWLMFIHLGIDFAEYLHRGYWISVWQGAEVHSTYNLEFGYDLLPFEITFLYSALKNKKLIHLAMAVVGGILLLAGGSRGPILDIFLFFAAYIFVSVQKSKKRFFIIFGLIVVAVFLYLEYIPILNGVSQLLSKAGLSSRLIKKMIEGTASDDNGRTVIWARAIQMIKDKPWGYGAMGSRHGIYDLIEPAHPHNVFLEILIDYGVVAGTGIIIAGFVFLLRTLKMPNIGEWKGLVLIFAGVTSQLLLSGTYWHRMGVWALLALGMSIHHFRKTERNRLWLRVGQETL